MLNQGGNNKEEKSCLTQVAQLHGCFQQLDSYAGQSACHVVNNQLVCHLRLGWLGATGATIVFTLPLLVDHLLRLLYASCDRSVVVSLNMGLGHFCM